MLHTYYGIYYVQAFSMYQCVTYEEMPESDEWYTSLLSLPLTLTLTSNPNPNPNLNPDPNPNPNPNPNPDQVQ